MTTPTLAGSMRERELQTGVLSLARLMGLLVYHTYDSRRSQPGFPDLVIVGPRGVLYRELKTINGRVSPDQQKWLAALQRAGQDAGVWRPDQWPDVIQDEMRRVA